jgi:alkanesulfonate monooxygenase SsuD/methylene tetrahydromethanopterin reductase-like flavin-dependent oxidoreductase (luciferase family)
MKYALTYHVEGPKDRPSEEIYAEILDQVVLADGLGFHYAWFSEHHAHVHYGHMPCPLMLALHAAGRTRHLHPGTAVVCLNMHSALDIAEQVAVADHLAGGRLSPGFGSGSTPQELALFGLPPVDAEARHARFAESLRVMRAVWAGEKLPEGQSGADIALPLARKDLPGRVWLAANSPEAARIAGQGGYNMMFSYLRTPEQYESLYAEYQDAGGTGSVAANRPVYVGEDDESAWEEAEPALRTLWRRFQSEGKIPAETPEPTSIEGLAAHPTNFIIGGPAKVARELRELHAQVPFDVANVELRWAGLSHPIVLDSLRRLMEDVLPLCLDERATLAS